MLSDPVCQPLVDGEDYLHGICVPQRLGEGALERLPLLGGGHGRLGVEHRINKLLVKLIRLAGVEQGVVDVGRPVVKGGEQKTKLRRGHYLAGGVVELVVAGEVVQLRLAQLHRADTAEDVSKYVLGAIRNIVLAPAGDIVAVAGQQEQVTAFAHVQAVDDLLIKVRPGLSVLQGSGA